MAESKERCIPLPEMPLGIFKLLLQFIYTDSVTVSSSMALGMTTFDLNHHMIHMILMRLCKFITIDLMHGAREYQLEGLLTLLEEYMQNRVTNDNVCVSRPLHPIKLKVFLICSCAIIHRHAFYIVWPHIIRYHCYVMNVFDIWYTIYPRYKRHVILVAW
jgi:hypothetical protein